MTIPETPPPAPNAGPPKWLIYGVAAKVVLIAAVILGVLWWKGIIF